MLGEWSMNAVSRLRNNLDKSRYGRKLSHLIRKTGLVYVYHKFMYKTLWHENSFFSYDEYQKELDELNKILCDEFSKKTVRNLIEFRKSKNMKLLKEIIVENQYFQKELLIPRNYEVFIDGGAYVGDTIESFRNVYMNGNDSSFMAYAWEPDEKNWKILKKTCAGLNVKIVPYGLWSKKESLTFTENVSGNSCIDKNGNKIVRVDSIDNIHGNEKITFIKMDIEGAEIEALKGAKNVIMNQKPKLAICIYHKPEHLFEIPLLIHEFVPEYKFYIRHHSDTLSETVLYCSID